MKRELFRYGIIGSITTLLNYISFYILAQKIGIYYMAANTAAWCLSVIFAYITNRRYVFLSKGEWKKEFFLFLAARVMTLLLENGILYLLVRVWNMKMFCSKAISCIVVIIGNYVICKKKIFIGADINGKN